MLSTTAYVTKKLTSQTAYQLDVLDVSVGLGKLLTVSRAQQEEGSTGQQSSPILPIIASDAVNDSDRDQQWAAIFNYLRRPASREHTFYSVVLIHGHFVLHVIEVDTSGDLTVTLLNSLPRREHEEDPIQNEMRRRFATSEMKVKDFKAPWLIRQVDAHECGVVVLQTIEDMMFRNALKDSSRFMFSHSQKDADLRKAAASARECWEAHLGVPPSTMVSFARDSVQLESVPVDNYNLQHNKDRQRRETFITRFLQMLCDAFMNVHAGQVITHDRLADSIIVWLLDVNDHAKENLKQQLVSQLLQNYFSPTEASDSLRSFYQECFAQAFPAVSNIADNLFKNFVAKVTATWERRKLPQTKSHAPLAGAGYTDELQTGAYPSAKLLELSNPKFRDIQGLCTFLGDTLKPIVFSHLQQTSGTKAATVVGAWFTVNMPRLLNSSPNAQCTAAVKQLEGKIDALIKKLHALLKKSCQSLSDPQWCSLLAPVLRQAYEVLVHARIINKENDITCHQPDGTHVSNQLRPLLIDELLCIWDRWRHSPVSGPTASSNTLLRTSKLVNKIVWCEEEYIRRAIEEIEELAQAAEYEQRMVMLETLEGKAVFTSMGV